ncbi:MAG: hypothetical protein PHH98_00685 [Candidatus Gracilibacteria bacterium]|nr:hypothetical protein [Candidatus Gracilibacteria bacterium]
MAFNQNDKGTSPLSLGALALSATLLTGNVDAKTSENVDTARLGVQDQVGKTLVHTSTEMKLDALLSQTEPVLLAGAEGVKGVYDFSRLQSLGSYKEMNDVEQGKVKKMYDLLVNSAKGDEKKEEGVKYVILNFIMFLKSISYNPESTINKSEKYLNETITNLKKYGFGEEFVQGIESSRKLAQEKDKYNMYLASLSESELLEKIKTIEKEIAEMKKETAEMKKETAEMKKETAEMKKENDKIRERIKAKEQILNNLRQVRDAMSKKTA